MRGLQAGRSKIFVSSASKDKITCCSPIFTRIKGLCWPEVEIAHVEHLMESCFTKGSVREC